jgi:hypothetical protein
MQKLIRDVVSFLFAVVELLLVGRFLLKLLGANAEAQFVSWIFLVTEPLIKPFVFAFPTTNLRGGFVIEFSTILAFFVYAFVGYLLEQILSFLMETPPTPSEEK